eukprot:TRINITY_DN90878_c0_g1_i1.p1 TRINITY_DN90878_c0_g1~~TRINITY_DN90878_c0_g1_i1.p1  ORF type:complete len:216 (-),score=41.83 TRINITY_DN90878_c0_g1_i1:55-702(-)
MLQRFRSMWGEASPVGEGQGQENADAGQAQPGLTYRRIRPWFVLLLMVQVTLVALRWQMGDAHGALLMLSVFIVGVLALTAGIGEVDGIYGGYFGMMAFVSGLLDLNLAIEHIIWSEWKQWQNEGITKSDLANLAKPGLYLACAVSQLASAFVAYILYKEAESMDDEFFDEPLFASAEQAQIYNAVLSHTDPSRGSRQASQDPMKSFAGSSHKLP